MRHGIGPGFGGNAHQMLRDERAGNGGAQQIEAFVQGIGAKHGEDEIAHEFFTHIDDVDIFRLYPQQNCLFTGGFQFFALPQIGGKGDDFAAIFGLQPFQNDGGIKTARIGEDDFFRGKLGGHISFP